MLKKSALNMEEDLEELGLYSYDPLAGLVENFLWSQALSIYV